MGPTKSSSDAQESRIGLKVSSALSECSCVAPNDATHVLQMKVVRKGRPRWHNQEGEEATDLLGSGGDKLATTTA